MHNLDCCRVEAHPADPAMTRFFCNRKFWAFWWFHLWSTFFKCLPRTFSVNSKRSNLWMRNQFNEGHLLRRSPIIVLHCQETKSQGKQCFLLMLFALKSNYLVIRTYSWTTRSLFVSHLVCLGVSRCMRLLVCQFVISRTFKIIVHFVLYKATQD